MVGDGFMLSSGGADAMRAADAVEAEAWEDLYAAAPVAFAARTGLRTERAGGAVLFLAPGLASATFNRALGLGLFRPATEADVDEVLEAFRAAGARRFWVHTGGACEPAEIPAWLRARGLCPLGATSWAKTVRGREEAPEVGGPFDVREVGREHAEGLARALVDAHGLPAPTVGWFAALVGRSRWRAFAAFDGEALAGGGMLYAHGGRAWLGLAGTLPAFRRRGAQCALLALRVREALAAGCETLVCEAREPAPGDSSAPLENLLRCGFRQAFSRQNYAPP